MPGIRVLAGTRKDLGSWAVDLTVRVDSRHRNLKDEAPEHAGREAVAVSESACDRYMLRVFGVIDTEGMAVDKAVT